MMNPDYWWEAFPTFFPVACWMAAQYPDDMNRMRAKKQWKDKSMKDLYDSMYGLWSMLNEEEAEAEDDDEEEDEEEECSHLIRGYPGTWCSGCGALGLE